MDDVVNERKLEHLRIIQADPEVDRRRHYFDAFRLQHRALPEVNLEDVDPTTEFMGKRLSFPLVISSMTGGDHELLRRINCHLAQAAERCGVAMAVGSQRVMFDRPAAEESFRVRVWAPTTLIWANLGAVQLNRGFGLEHCRRALEVAGADALCLHLNPLQEAVQPRGDTHFAGLASRIKGIVGALDKPVVVKEVGAGISAADAALLAEAGVRYVDVAGAGGTSWSRIEHHSLMEEEGHDLGWLFQDWGIPTPAALRALKPLRDRLILIASGGIRTGIDMVKAMVLGASLCGIARPFLEPAMDSVEAVVAVIERIKREFVTAMFLTGTRRVADLIGNEELLAAE